MFKKVGDILILISSSLVEEASGYLLFKASLVYIDLSGQPGLHRP